MMQGWSIRRFEDADEAAVRNLHASVFNEFTDLSYWVWKYKENPVGSMRYVAEDKREGIVGHYGLIFQKIRIGDKIVTGSQAVDAMTHPNFQRQGMFVKLGREILNRAGSEGNPFTFGFPNDAALPGHKKVGWAEVCEVPVLLKPLNIASIFGKRVKNTHLLKIGSNIASIPFGLVGQGKKIQLESLSVKSVTCFDERINEFWSRVAPSYKVIQVRDKEFLNWRYVANPHKYTILIAEKDATLVGYAVLGEMTVYGIRGGAIVDILAYPDQGQISEFLISRAIEQFQKKNMGYVGCMMRRGSMHYRVLKRHGFIATPEKVRFILHLNSDRFSMPTEVFDKWFLTWGDSDCV
jgi:hypothetical protein